MCSNSITVVLSLVAVLTLTPTGRGEITVNVNGCMTPPCDCSTLDYNQSLDLWFIVLCQGEGENLHSFLIQSDSGEDSIGSLVMIPTNDLESPYGVILGSALSPVKDVHSVTVEALDEEEFAPIEIINLSLTGDLGEVQGVTVITASSVEGDVIGPIRLVGLPPQRAILNLFSSNGSLFGDVAVEPDSEAAVLGIIGLLEFRSGVIMRGDGGPVTIVADQCIGGVIAKEINAEFRGSRAENDYFVNEIFSLETTTDNNGSGVFHAEASIRASALSASPQVARYLRFAGEMRGRIYLEEGLEGNGNEITMPTEGLKGLIMFNARNQTGAGSWTVPIKIGTGQNQITLRGDSQFYPAPGEYPQKASQLGGGSVGLVPFRLHRTDCFPRHNSIVDPNAVEPDERRPDPNNPIKMRHYGPVAWDSRNGTPFKVERRRVGGCSPECWTDESSCFTQALDDNPTIVKLTPSVPLQRGFEYRVSRRTFGSPAENVLRCDLPTGATPQVANYPPLVFQVCDAFPAHAPGDANDDGIVDQYDASSVLTNWGSTACLKFGDATRDGAVNGADLQEVELYDTWEYCYSSGQSFTGDGAKPTSPGLAFGETGTPSATMGFDGGWSTSAPMSITQAVQYMGWADIADFSESYDGFNEAQRWAVRTVLMALITGE